MVAVALSEAAQLFEMSHGRALSSLMGKLCFAHPAKTISQAGHQLPGRPGLPSC
jgi:hypothetical protein